MNVKLGFIELFEKYKSCFAVGAPAGAGLREGRFWKSSAKLFLRGSAKFCVILLTEKLQGVSLSTPKSQMRKEELAFLFPPCSSGHAFPRKRGKAK